ncbi:MAG: hypothetical protein HYR84_03350 [Planctomycetes bacterium]|nr:hypothetical protein [Planctomycetota bacterium]
MNIVIAPFGMTRDYSPGLSEYLSGVPWRGFLFFGFLGSYLGTSPQVAMKYYQTSECVARLAVSRESPRELPRETAKRASIPLVLTRSYGSATPGNAWICGKPSDEVL